MNLAKNSKNSKAKKGLFYNFWYDFVKVTGCIPALLWWRPKVYRPYGTKTPKGRVLVSANHRSFFDPIILLITFPFRRLHSLATKDLYKTKFMAAFLTQMHCIMVDKQNFTLSAFHDVVTRLQEEKMVVIFPEGGLNEDSEDTIKTFKSGAVLMAHKANAPLLPVYIVKRKKWYHRQRVVIGEVFDVRKELGDRPSIEQLNNASDTLRKMELDLQEYFDSLPISKKVK